MNVMTRNSLRILFAIGALSMALHGFPAYAQAPSRTTVGAYELSGALETTTRQVTPAVVEIFTTSYAPTEGMVRGAADLVTTQRGSGSGVVVDPNGYILTNAHVIRGAHRVRVEIPLAIQGQSILASRIRTLHGTVVGVDEETDLAVIKVDAQNLETLPFGDSDELKAGQLVLAVGSPAGLRNSVSLGVVSAIARQLEPESPMVYVQTDAAINPGNSGGPLVDLRGRIVGINTLIFSQSGGYDGLGFAAPSNIARTVYEQIRKSGRVHRGDIGIRAQTITPTLASGLALARDHGAMLSDVRPRSPAAFAGLLPGDLVVSLDGKPMENGRQLQIDLYRHVPGDVVSLEILREGQRMTVPVAMGQREEFADLSSSIDPREHLVSRLGILGLDLDPRLATLLPVVRTGAGVVVVSTVPGALDSRDGGLAAGDVIFAVNRRSVGSLADLRKILDALQSGDPVVLQLERRGELMYVAFTID
jgi:serine protease Do